MRILLEGAFLFFKIFRRSGTLKEDLCPNKILIHDNDVIPKGNFGVTFFVEIERRTVMETVKEYFGCNVFDDREMKANLPAKVYQSLKKTIDEGAALDVSVANIVAEAMKE